MTWEQIRTTYPDRWVLMEALDARTEGDRRVFCELSVLDTVDNNTNVFPRYNEYRKRFPNREIIFYHASNAQMDVQVRVVPGFRNI